MDSHKCQRCRGSVCSEHQPPITAEAIYRAALEEIRTHCDSETGPCEAECQEHDIARRALEAAARAPGLARAEAYRAGLKAIWDECFRVNTYAELAAGVCHLVIRAIEGKLPDTGAGGTETK